MAITYTWYYYYLEAAEVVRCISLAVAHLHHMQVAHRDLKVITHLLLYIMYNVYIYTYTNLEAITSLQSCVCMCTCFSCSCLLVGGGGCGIIKAKHSKGRGNSSFNTKLLYLQVFIIFIAGELTVQ